MGEEGERRRNLVRPGVQGERRREEETWVRERGGRKEGERRGHGVPSSPP